ncbi:MAG: glycosyltransferase family A protein [bacterium]|nr:glycosyltransferase family A protein [bacterium]
MPQVSIVIRARNEDRWIGTLLKKLREQTFKNFEIILVDNESTDKTREIAKKYKVDQIINLPKDEFNYSYALNLGIQKAKGKYMVITSAHCEPLSNTWLEDGLRYFEDPKVAGVDGHFYFGPSGTWAQQIGDWLDSNNKKKPHTNWPLTATNCIIRKDLWKEYPFDERLNGCEDWDWAKEMIARGYKTVKEPKFNVYHHHRMEPVTWLLMELDWRKTILFQILPKKRPSKSYTKITT